METVCVMERSFEKALTYEKEDDGKLGRLVERGASVQRNGTYIVRDRITIKLDETAGASSVFVRRSWTESFASGLVDILR